MKKLVQINGVNFGSTGNIMLNIASVAEKSQFSSYVACSNSRQNRRRKIKNQIYINSIVLRNLGIFLSKLTGLNGCFSILGTGVFLNKLNKVNPDILHLHNLHNCYINLPMLFKWIKKKKIRVIWTLHDCWAFTGQCPHFTFEECDKWKRGCFDCVKYRDYPSSYVDRTKTMYKLKRKWFTGVENMTIVTPSEWLADLVKQSFLKEYDVKVINNGIDLNVFKPTDSAFKERYEIQDKFIILGVASLWTYKKGLDVFIELANKLDDKFRVVLVGVSDKQIRDLPENIIGIERTSSKEELAEYYTMADVFVNPTREDNFPTVNIEALACGTPVITFKIGGSPESIDETCGMVVPKEDVAAMKKAIEFVGENKPFSNEACVNRSKAFDKNEKFNDYIDIYNEKG